MNPSLLTTTHATTTLGSFQSCFQAFLKKTHKSDSFSKAQLPVLEGNLKRELGGWGLYEFH